MKGLLLLPCLAAAAPNAWRRWRRQQQQQMPEPVAPEWTKEMPQTWEPANSLKDWRGVAPACAWCAHVDQKHAYCQGFGGRFCDDGADECSIPQRELDRHCTKAYAATGLDACVARCDGVLRENACAARCLHAAQSAVRPDACAARCAHAASAAPRECVETWVSNNEDAALVASKGCHQSVDAFFHGSQTDTLSVLIHLQKTGGWSVVDAARAAGVRCPSVIANADGRRSTEHLDGCAGYRASTPQDEGLLRASVVGQQAVLSAHHRMFGLLHVEQPLSRVWPAFLGTRQVLYVTVLRDPLKRALSHFKMATREVHIPGIYSGLPFGRVVELQEFADRPLRDCLLCSRRGRASDRTQGYFGVDAKRNASTLIGGGEFRHCCRRQWRYAADNYYSRELCGFTSLAELPFGEVNKTHGDEASRRLDAFDAVLITERLTEARPVLAAKLGWRLPRDVAVPWRNKGAQEAEEYSEAALAALEARNAIDRAVYARAARAFDASLRKRRPRRRRHDGDVL